MSLSEVVAEVLAVIGAGLVALAGLGVIRLPDALTRTSAVSKAAALGVLVIVAAVAVNDPSPGVLAVLALIVVAHVVTVPLGGMTLGGAAYRSGTVSPSVTRVDEPAGRPAADHDAESAN